MKQKMQAKYLFQRSGIYWFRRRLSGTRQVHRKSLNTRDLNEAIRARDQILKGWDEIDRKVSDAQNLIAIRRRYLSATNPEEKAQLEELIQDEAEDMAQSLGVLEKLHMKSVVPDSDDLIGDERKPVDFYKTATGRLTIFKEFIPDWLETIPNKKTRSDYRRAFDLLMEKFVAVEELDWDKCKVFLRDRIRVDRKATPTVMKWKSGYIKFWDYLDKNPSIWKDHILPKTEPLDIQPFSAAEVRAMYDKTKQEQDEWGPWLHHVIWIAAHTGARAGAIVGLKYNKDDETIWLPRKKKERKDRIIPAHPAIHSSLEYWENNRKEVQTVSNKFKGFKRERGYGREHVFHSFRHTLVTELENVECPEAVAMDITGHKKKGIAYGIYSGGSGIPLMRRYLEQVRY